MSAGFCDKVRECCFCCLLASKDSKDDDERETYEEVDEATIQSDEDSNPSEREDAREDAGGDAEVDRDSGRRTATLNYGSNPSEIVRSRGDPEEYRPELADEVDTEKRQEKGTYGGRQTSDFVGSDSEEEDENDATVPRKGESVIGGRISKSSTVYRTSVPEEHRPELPGEVGTEKQKEKGTYDGRQTSDFMGSGSQEEDEKDATVPRKGESVFGGRTSKSSSMDTNSATELDVSEDDVRAVSNAHMPADESNPLLEALLEDEHDGDDLVDPENREEKKGTHGGRRTSDFMGSDSEEEDDENDAAVPRKGESVFGGRSSKSSAMRMTSAAEPDVSEGDVRAVSHTHKSDPLLEPLLQDEHDDDGRREREQKRERRSKSWGSF